MNFVENDYVLSDALKEALLVVEVTGRPLLVKGEPGTGKTQLAHHVAKTLMRPLFQWPIKSTTIAKDGAYFYDAVSRLNDARFAPEGGEGNVHQIEKYIHMGPLGKAFTSPEAAILLIDEIDKADLEFPNDLLLELDQMEFIIPETQKTIKAKHRPLVIITSNNEKELPDAFLRRCIFHYIEFPKMDFMKSIVETHFPKMDNKLLNQALTAFYRLRDMEELKKKPSTSELIDWIQILLHQGAELSKGENPPFIGTLIKNEEDLLFFRKKSSYRD